MAFNNESIPHLSDIISTLPIEAQQILHQHPIIAKVIEDLIRLIGELQAEVEQLRTQLKLDSHNSSKPPSTDKVRNHTQSLRQSTGRPPGGQKGHPGKTLSQVPHPDHKISHKVTVCKYCRSDLSGFSPKTLEKRQVFDLPSIKMEITEHQAEIKDCPLCGLENRGVFPEGIDRPVQYGKGIKAIMVYLNQYQLIPYERTIEIIEDIFGGSPSQGTLLNTVKEVYHNLKTTEEGIKQGIIDSPVAHFDETGYYEDGSRKWLHTASTPEFTLYYPHPKRGREGMDEAGIIPNFKGVGVHDNFKTYYLYTGFIHALCNSHHLRELTYAHEQENASWANRMKTLLLEIKEKVEESKENERHSLEPLEIMNYHQEYEKILSEGLLRYPLISDNPDPPKRGRKRQSKSKNLLDRLLKHRKEVLRFMEDFRVPFDNNLVERDQRMAKTQQKISGCFRSHEGAKYFCRIRGFISTLKKQKKNVLEYLKIVCQHSSLPRNILLTEVAG